jgi:hypothetical protein
MADKLPTEERIVNALEEIADKLGALRTELQITNDQLRGVNSNIDYIAINMRTAD